jgi:hypothetical protein
MWSVPADTQIVSSILCTVWPPGQFGIPGTCIHCSSSEISGLLVVLWEMGNHFHKTRSIQRTHDYQQPGMC